MAFTSSGAENFLLRYQLTASHPQRYLLMKTTESIANAATTKGFTMSDSVPHAPIATEKVFFERKIFFLDLKENARGRFLKITEDVAGRRDTIMVPMEGASDIVEALKRLVEFEATL